MRETESREKREGGRERGIQERRKGERQKEKERDPYT